MSPLSAEAARWIERLDLRPHREGGYFRETYRAAESVARAALPPRYDGPRAFMTAIYFLLPGGEISALHRLRSDELWFFHAGSALTVVTLAEDGALVETRLGPDVDRGERWQTIVGAGHWFGAMVEAAHSFALVGCTVAPGFEFADFELGERGALVRRFPQHRATIERLTHATPPTRPGVLE
jgi:predicted cupin superfamily sugar epimerase